MIEILFFSVLIVGVLTEILYKKIEKFKPVIISFSVALVLTLLCTHVLPELFSPKSKVIGAILSFWLFLKILIFFISNSLYISFKI